MTDSVASDRSEAVPAPPEGSGEVARAWYLYGITTPGPLEGLAAIDPDRGPLHLLASSGLAAVVRLVPMTDFTPSALQERLRSAAAVEEMVRSHNRVIEAVHGQRAILPAKFGSVYARPEDVFSALDARHDALVDQLSRLEGCDEWAVHLYADRPTVADRVSAHDTAIVRLRAERAAAKPGRAYFLDRQIQSQVTAATDQALVMLAQRVFERLEGCAVAAEASPVSERVDAAEQVEILRASFLVAREHLARFEDEVRACADAGDGLSCEYSGPWPPYSFAGRGHEARV